MKSTFKVSSQPLGISSLFAIQFKFSFLYIIHHLSQSIFKYNLLNANQCIAHLLTPSPSASRLKAMFKNFPNVTHCLNSFDPNHAVCPTFGPLRFFLSKSFLTLEAAVYQHLCMLAKCLPAQLSCHTVFSCVSYQSLPCASTSNSQNLPVLPITNSIFFNTLILPSPNDFFNT